MKCEAGSGTRRGLDILYAGTLPPHPGGSAVMCGQLLLALARMGHTIRAVAPIVDNARSSVAPFGDDCEDLTVARVAVPRYATVPDFLIHSFHSHLDVEQAAVRAKLSSWLQERLPDVVMLGREPCLWYLPEESASVAAPVFLVVHSLISHRWMSGLYPEHLCGEIRARFRRVAQMATPAGHVAHFLKSAGLEQVEVIPNPVDLERFAPKAKRSSLLRELSIDPDAVVVLHASNLKAVKRPMDVVESAEAALRENPSLVYVVVGDGEYRPSMLEACRQKGIGDRFRFVGWVEHAAMPDYLNLADIVVMTSEVETQALLYLEAQACEKVLIASDIPAARQVVVDGENGLLFRTGDVGHLTTQILKAASDPALREKIGGMARQAMASHSLPRVAAAYDALLRQTARSG